MSVPITGTQHPLPFERLSGADFERLCLWLIAREGYERIADYGARGGPDGGRDFEAWRGRKRIIFQCKRVKSFTAAAACQEIDKLRELPQKRQPDALCFLVSTDPTSNTLDMAQEAWWGEPKDCWFLSGRQLDERVRRYPEIVEAFFQENPGGEGHSIDIDGDVFQSPVVLGDGNTIIFQHGRYRVRPKRYRCLAPHPGDGFVHRQELDEMVDRLTGYPRDEARVSTLATTMALQGAGGFGKTILAQALCHDPRVQAVFPGGVLWLVLGEGLDDTGRIRSILDGLRLWIEGNPPTFESAEIAGIYLREQLHGHRVLVVLDDVWQQGDVRPFEGLDAGSALLITTRHRDILPSGTEPLEVDQMKSAEAVQLLSAELDEDSVDFEPLVRQLGEWPLLLKLVNGQLRKRVRRGVDVSEAIRQVQTKLADRGLSAFDRSNAEERADAVRLTMAAGFESGLLSSEDQERYFSLAIFPKDTDIPVDVLVPYWDLSKDETLDVVERLFDFSLLQRLDGSGAVIRPHDTFHRYLIGIIDAQQGQLAGLHHRFLDAHRPTSGRWMDLDRSARYLWRHLAHHLVGAGEKELLVSLLLDFDYLWGKLDALDLNAILADIAQVPSLSTLRVLADALRLSAHVSLEDAGLLAGQLLGRLSEIQELKLQPLLNQARQVPGLLPRRATLRPPGGPLVRTLVGHVSEVYVVKRLGRDRIVSASSDGTLRVWDVASGVCEQTLEGHTAGVVVVECLEAERIVSGSYDGTLRIWDVASGDCEQILEGHAAGVVATKRLDERRIVSASYDRTLRVWDTASGICEQVLEGHSDWVQIVESLHDGRVVSASDDGTLRVWDVASGVCDQTLEGHQDWVFAVQVLDESRIVSASDDGTLRVWDVLSGVCVGILEGHTGGVRAVEHIDGRRIVSASDDGTLRIWDLDSGTCERTMEGHRSGARALARLDEVRVVSASREGTLRIWDVNWGICEQTLEGHTAEIRALERLDDGWIVSASDDGALRIWDVASGAQDQRPEGHHSKVRALGGLEGGRVVSASDDGTLRVWDVASGACEQTLEGHSSRILAFRTLPDGRVVSASKDRSLRVWDAASGACEHVLEGHTDWVLGLERLDSERVVSASRDGTLRVWDVSSGACEQELRGHTSAVLAVQCIDEDQIVSASEDQTLRVWGVSSGACEEILRGHTDWIRALERLDGRRVVSASDDGTLRVWDVTLGVCQQTLKGHEGWVVALKRLDSDRIVSASRDGTLRVWDLSSGVCEQTLEGHIAGIFGLERVDKRRVASASSDGTLRIWDLTEGRSIAAFHGEGGVRAFTVFDTRTLVAGDSSGVVHFLDLVR